MALAAPEETTAVGADKSPGEMVFPWSSTTASAAKSVVMPKTALNLSACNPVFAVAVSAAAFALAQVALAVASAPQLFTSWSHMNWLMMSMFCAEPWL